jgi:triose/dihydroxyacetone kinase / FAD-AMP lyase (cyclizing)
VAPAEHSTRASPPSLLCALITIVFSHRIFFAALAQGLQSSDIDGESRVATKDLWVRALTTALAKLYSYTRARPPSRTLVDPISAFVEAMPLDFDDAVAAARDAAEATRGMDAKVGRSAYVDVDRLRKQRIPDPGAWGVKIILESL